MLHEILPAFNGRDVECGHVEKLFTEVLERYELKALHALVLHGKHIVVRKWVAGLVVLSV